MYLEKRFKKYYAFHDIPADVQDKLPYGARYCARLDTSDLQTARRRKVLLEVQLLAEIEAARKGTAADPLEAEARFWRERLKAAKEHDGEAGRELVMDLLIAEVEARNAKAARANGTMNDHELPDDPEAMRLFQLATGKLVKLTEHLDAWLDSLKRNIPRTKAQKKALVLRFASVYPYVQDINRKVIQKWVWSLEAEGLKRDTITKNLSELRGLWKYLVSHDIAPDNIQPFDQIVIPDGNGHDDEERKPFTASQVVELLAEAEARKQSLLADLIRLGMWTGARIEELGSLKVEAVHGLDWFEVVDAKTKAGVRAVPIHSKLKPVVARLVRDSKDGYLLSGLSVNKYGDRSSAIGKRFGRLKTDMGFGPAHVFHSIRKTMITLLENAKPRVDEGIAADIVGHEKGTMTYGVYSSGSEMDTKREAIERALVYPSPSSVKAKAPASR